MKRACLESRRAPRFPPDTAATADPGPADGCLGLAEEEGHEALQHRRRQGASGRSLPLPLALVGASGSAGGVDGEEGLGGGLGEQRVGRGRQEGQGQGIDAAPEGLGLRSGERTVNSTSKHATGKKRR